MKTAELRNAKHEAKKANRHNIISPAEEINRARWARAITTLRVSDLFKTLKGLDGHWMQVQNEINRANGKFIIHGTMNEEDKNYIRFISDAVVNAASDATFDFPLMQLKFASDMGWLKISRVDGRLEIWSRP